APERFQDDPRLTFRGQLKHPHGTLANGVDDAHANLICPRVPARIMTFGGPTRHAVPSKETKMFGVAGCGGLEGYAQLESPHATSPMITLPPTGIDAKEVVDTQ